MAKPVTTFTHATDANFTSGPAIGKPTKIAAPTPQGIIPGTGIVPEMLNWLLHVTGNWVGWLAAGKSTAAEDAHIVETDDDGRGRVAGVVLGSTGAGFPAITANENSGSAASTISTTNNSNGFALLGSASGSAAAIRGVSGGSGAALEGVSTGPGHGLNVSGTAHVSGTVTLGGVLAVTGIVSPLAGINLGTQTMSGSAGSLVDVTTTKVTQLDFNNSGLGLAAATGRIRWNETFFSFLDGVGQARTFEEPVRGYAASLVTLNAIADTGAAATRRIRHNEEVWIEVSARVECSASPTTLAMRIGATGPLGYDEPMVTSYRIVATDVGFAVSTVYRWKPTDSWPAASDIQSYAIKLRLGINSGTLTASRCSIKVSSDFFIP